MNFRIALLLYVCVTFPLTIVAQCEDYQMFRALNSSAQLINYLEQNDFTESSHPDSTFFHYIGKYTGDYINVSKGYRGEVIEMSWSVLDESGNVIPERLSLGNMEFKPTYKENRKLHPSIFSDKKPLPNGTWSSVDFGLGKSKIRFDFEDSEASKKPKIRQITMLVPNKSDLVRSALNRQKKCFKELATSNIPKGTNPFAYEIAESTGLYFKKALSLSLKEGEVVSLDLPQSMLNAQKNANAVIYVRLKNATECISSDCLTKVNFIVTTEKGEYIGDSESLQKKPENSYGTINTEHLLSNNLNDNVSFKAEISFSHTFNEYKTIDKLELDIYYFEGANTEKAYITRSHSYNTQDILWKRDYVPPHIDAFDQRITAIKGTSIFDPELSESSLPASKSLTIYNRTIPETSRVLIKAEGDVAPSLRLDYEAYRPEGNNRGTTEIDKNSDSYRFVDGYHLYEFDLKTSFKGWMKFDVTNNDNKPQNLTWLIRYQKPGSTVAKIETELSLNQRTEKYFERIQKLIENEIEEGQKRLQAFRNSGQTNGRTKDEYLNGVENRIIAGVKAGGNASKYTESLLDIVGSSQSGRPLFKKLLDAHAEFKAHISQATLYSISAKCDKAYDILNNIEDDWFGYSGEAIQVDLANMENAVNTGNRQGFARWSQDYIKAMQAIMAKIEKALLAVEGCR